MPGPAPSKVCPACRIRPRARKGSRCRPCRTDEQRTRRARQREAAAPRTFWRQLEGQRFLVTSAQNATPVHAEFLATLKAAAKAMRAELVVIPLRYRNPTSTWSDKQETDEWWAPELEPYLFNGRKKLGPNLVLCADVKIQPTASNPLAGFQSLTGAESCIIGHPKMAFRSVPAPSGRFPKILTTTGSVTKKNFTDSKAGALGAFHHYLGALVVELDGRHFHLRQVNADRKTGEFIDLDRHYGPRGVTKAAPALGLVLGDTHARFACPKVDAATFGPGGIVERLNPEHVVFHDLFDGWSVNPHHEGNPFIAVAKHRSASGSVLSEIRHAVQFVAERVKGRRAIIVPSNHDNFLSRWVINTDWRRSPGNAEFYLETAAAMVKSTRTASGGAEFCDPLIHWIEKLKGNAPIRCLAPDESFRLADVELGLHGDRGPNGSRGGLRNLSRIGARVITGHSHTPGIEEGHYQCGTSTPLRLEYTRGPSSWLNTHCVVYASGKRALITIIDGEWHG